MTRAPVACAACMVAVAAVATLAAQATIRIVTRPDGAVDRAVAWVDAVLDHTPGTRDPAIDRLDTWSDDSLTHLFVELASIRALMRDPHTRAFPLPIEFDRGRPAEIRYARDERQALDAAAGRIEQQGLRESDFVARAIALHSDQARFSQGTGTVIHFADGRDTGRDRYASDQLKVARRLADTLRSRDGRDEDVAFWYRATLARMAAVEHWNGDHAAHAIERYPDDAEVRFLVGAHHERLAAPRIQAVMDASPSLGGLSVRVGSAASELRDAASHLKRAVDLDPRHADARIHYGRVLTLTGRAAAAIPELRRALAGVPAVNGDPEAGESMLRYFGHLFLGAALEAVNQREAARAAYQAAADLYPDAQSPRLALTHLAYAAGARSEAEDALASLLALPADEAQRVDPWWAYFASVGRDADALMTEAARLLATPRPFGS